MTAPVQSSIDRVQAWGLFFLWMALPAAAAPLDALLTALPEPAVSKGHVEIGSDHMNQRLDFFNIRDSHLLAAGTQAGDYHGGHLAGGWQFNDNLWLSGSLWQRNLNGLSGAYNFNTWQASGLYRFLDGNKKIPSLALRLSAWGNEAGEVSSANICAAPVANAPKTCQADAFLNSVKITNPSDQTLQADLVGTWNLSSATDISVLLGAGTTELSYGTLSGTTQRKGLLYQFSFIGNDIFGTTADGSSQFREKASKYGVDVAKELAWRGHFVQAGINAVWRSGPWTWRAGYLFHTVQRDAIDDILASRGWSVLTQIKSITLELNHRFSPRLSAFVRSQLSDKLIFNDLPVAYNTFSSDLFGGRYSIYSFGLRYNY